MEYEHPLDPPLEFVTNDGWPNAEPEARWDDMGNYYTDSEELDEC